MYVQKQIYLSERNLHVIIIQMSEMNACIFF
jgi:hypothetical protein